MVDALLYVVKTAITKKWRRGYDADKIIEGASATRRGGR